MCVWGGVGCVQPARACTLAGCPGAWARSPNAAAGGAGSARDAVRCASPAGCPTCEGREADSAAREGNGAARSAAACALPLPQRPRLWLRRSRAVSVLQLHEGVVVGRKTCVKALLRACLSLDSRFALSPKCSSSRWRRMVKMQLIIE